MKFHHLHVAVRDLPGALGWLKKVWDASPTFENGGMAVLSLHGASVILDAADEDGTSTIGFASDNCDEDYRPGHNPLSGEGKDQVLALMGKVIQLADGSFRPDVHDILASADHVAALVTVHATRGGTPTEWQSVDLYHICDGRISEHWVHEVDQETRRSILVGDQTGTMTDLPTGSGSIPQLDRRHEPEQKEMCG